MTRHPIGINQRQETDDERVLKFVQQMGGVRAHLCHFDNGALARMHRYKQWADILIWRPRDDVQERLFRTYPDPAQYVKNCRAQMMGRGFQPGDLWLHLHNEAEWSFTMLEWEHKAALAAVTMGMRVVVLNPSVGTPNENEISMAEKIIRLAADHPDRVIIGLHEYFSVYGWRKKPWYLNRWQTHQFEEEEKGHSFESFRKLKHIGPVRYLNTEFGADNISEDVEYARQFLRNGHIPRGVHELDQAWARTYHDAAHNRTPKPYPGIDEAYYEQLIQAYSAGNYADDAMEAALIFCWGDEWPTFDISRMTVLHRLLATWWQRNKPTAPLPDAPRPPVVPEPEPPVDVPEPPKTAPNPTRVVLERHVNSMRLLVETHHARRLILQAEMDALDAQAQMLQVELLLAEDALEQWTEAAHAA